MDGQVGIYDLEQRLLHLEPYTYIQRRIPVVVAMM